MVYITDPKAVTAELKISSAKFDPKAKKTEIVLIYEVLTANILGSVSIPRTIALDETSIQAFQTEVGTKRTKLSNALAKTRDSLASLLRIAPYIDVSAQQLAETLMQEVENQ